MTLRRNVKCASQNDIDEIMTSLKTRGFINYYGMQRFGTSCVGSHTIGLALLQGKWKDATSLILSKRPGEHPEAEAARDAWEKGNLDGALQIMPRRNVAERALWEYWKRPKADLTDHYSALLNVGPSKAMSLECIGLKDIPPPDSPQPSPYLRARLPKLHLECSGF
jgi:tRNA pseudouridine13 synthase